MANTNLTPSSGDLNLSVNNPRLMPLAGVLLAVGITVSLSTGSSVVRTPTAGAVTATGVQASLQQQGKITTNTGALVIGGQTGPASVSATPGTGAVTASGVASGVVQSRVITTGTGNLTLNKGLEITPPSGSLTATGSTVLVAQVIRPSTATLALASAPPVIAGNPVTFTPPSGSLLIGEFVGTPITLTPSTGGLNFGDALTAPLLRPAVVSMTIAGQAPSLLINIITTPNSGAVTAAGVASLIQGPRLTPATGTLDVVGPLVIVGKSFIPGAGSLTLTGAAPSIPGFVQPQPSSGALALTGSAPTVIATNFRTVTPGTGALAITGVLASTDRGLIPGSGSLVFAGGISAIAGQEIVTVPSGMALQGSAPVLFLQTIMVPRAGALVVAGKVPNIGGVPPRGGVKFKPRSGRIVFDAPLREEIPI